MTYTDFVEEYIEKRDYGEPIYTEDMVPAMATAFQMEGRKAGAALSVALKRVIDNGKIPELRRYQKGIYYRTQDSIFGEIGIDTGKIIDRKYIMPDKGYETGAGMFHRMGLTTHVPNMRYIATNLAHGCIKYDKELDVSICPPKTKVTGDNREYLRVLDILNQMDNVPCDADNPYDIIGNYIGCQKLSYEKLMAYADRFYNQRTLIRLGHVAGRNMR